ncbi:MAG: HAD family hydrolase [Thermoplasmata archaeon]
MPVRQATPRFLEPLLGVVFDLDGTLVVSQHDFYRMRREVIRLAEHYGVSSANLTVEMPMHRILETARESIRTSGAPDTLLLRFEAEFHQKIDGIEMQALEHTVVRSGARELVRGLTERGFRAGILTRSSEAFARAALVRTGLADFFPYLRSRSSPGPAKPSPEALWHLLQEMGVPPGRALYVGDHLLDAECATRAQVRFYAVLPDPGETTTGSMSVDRFLAAGAEAVAQDLTELARQLDVYAPSDDAHRPEPPVRVG